jgi:hypothetical protein
MSLLVPRLRDGGPPTGPCHTIYTTSVVETRAAVAFKVESARQTDPNADCADVEHNPWARAEVPLSQSLGNRVVIAADGSPAPYPVLPCGTIPARPLYVPSCEPSSPSDGPVVVTGGPLYGREYGPE